MPKEKETAHSKYNPTCERGLGIYRTCPEEIYTLWMYGSGRANDSYSIGDCKFMFRYQHNR